MPPEPSGAECSLDPADWGAFRALGHRMLDDMVDYLASVRSRPVWRPVPARVKARFDEDLPEAPSDAGAVYEAFKETVRPYPTGNIHPRFWGWVMGTGTPIAMLADMLASGMNANLAGWDQSATLVEKQVLRWLNVMIGFPATASGLLVSGGTTANLVGLAVARHVKAGWDVGDRGLQDHGPRLTVYGSSETHSWAARCCELLGLGRSALRLVPARSDYRVDVDSLREKIAADRRAGDRAICVIGNAGTVNTGATDDLNALSALCRDEDLWFHIDGAFGALAALSPTAASQLSGMEKADSIGFDLHKWGYLPYEVGCALVRDPRAHREAFASTAPYLASMPGGISPAPLEFADLGLELSRGFRALKVWMSLKVQGSLAWGAMIEQNISQARYLADSVEAHPSLELLAPVPLNVVCFRYVGEGLTPDALNALNEEILIRVQSSGVAVPSSTRLGTVFALRVANTNHRTRREDFDMLVDAVVAEGRKLEEKYG